MKQQQVQISVLWSIEMIEFESKIKFIPTWNDNDKSEKPIEIELKPLNVSDYYSLVSITNKAYIKPKSDKEKPFIDIPLMFQQSVELEKIYNGNVEVKSNLLMDNKVITVAQMFSNICFALLIIEINNKLLTVSTISEGLKKK